MFDGINMEKVRNLVMDITSYVFVLSSTFMDKRKRRPISYDNKGSCSDA